jgi:hypothetical protein
MVCMQNVASTVADAAYPSISIHVMGASPNDGSGRSLARSVAGAPELIEAARPVALQALVRHVRRTDARQALGRLAAPVEFVRSVDQ